MVSLNLSMRNKIAVSLEEFDIEELKKDFIEMWDDSEEIYMFLQKYDTSDAEEFIEEYGYEEEYDKSPYYAEEFITTLDVFKQWLEEFFYESVQEFLIEFRFSIGDNGKIDLYRAMIVPKNYIEHLVKEGKHVGIYWTNNIYAAQPHHGSFIENGMTVVLHTQVDEKHIDWYDSFLSRSFPGIGRVEEEIRLFKGTPLQILDMYEKRRNSSVFKPIDITPIEGMTFYA